MSNNHFEGSIPLELAELENLLYLDLSHNILIVVVPSFINSSGSIIHLNNNHLSGLSKRMINGSYFALSFDEIINGIEYLIQEHTRLNILLLKVNRFTGAIPKELCQLIDLSILPLSHHNFSGAYSIA